VRRLIRRPCIRFHMQATCFRPAHQSGCSAGSSLIWPEPGKGAWGLGGSSHAIVRRVPMKPFRCPESFNSCRGAPAKPHPAADAPLACARMCGRAARACRGRTWR
jgi:hypothetical protein